MIKKSLLLTLFLYTSLLPNEVHAVKKIKQQKPRIKQDTNINFFKEATKKQKSKFSFNEYEHIISGVGAFLIGNIGYLLTDSTALKIAYSGIQTIGIINIGQGVYQRNSPDLKKSFYTILTTNKVDTYSKPVLAKNLIKLFAQEERAKRLSLFFSTSFLSLQYLLNSTVYDSPDQVKNIYIFFSGINAIVATYSALYKGEYESQYYGTQFDINPLAFEDAKGNSTFGALLTYRF
jgi:hypothetical protein